MVPPIRSLNVHNSELRCCQQTNRTAYFVAFKETFRKIYVDHNYILYFQAHVFISRIIRHSRDTRSRVKLSPAYCGLSFDQKIYF